LVVIKCQCNISVNKSNHPIQNPLLFFMEPRIRDNMEGSGRDLIFGNIPVLTSRHLGKPNLSQDRWPPDRDLKSGPSEYEAGMLTSRPRGSARLLSHACSWVTGRTFLHYVGVRVTSTLRTRNLGSLAPKAPHFTGRSHTAVIFKTRK
jgi:hypothetical protein